MQLETAGLRRDVSEAGRPVRSGSNGKTLPYSKTQYRTGSQLRRVNDLGVRRGLRA